MQHKRPHTIANIIRSNSPQLQIIYKKYKSRRIQLKSFLSEAEWKNSGTGLI
jgi:hypothetical protein